MHLSGLEYCLWIGVVVGQMALLVTLLVHRQYRAFPVFVAFIGFVTLTEPLFYFFLNHTSPATYFKFYFAMKIPEALLEFAVLIEIAANVVRPVKRSLPAGILWLLTALILVGAGVGLTLAALSHPHSGNVLAKAFLQAGFAIALLRLTIFAAIVAFSQMLGIGWKNYVLQLASGLAFYSAVSLAVTLILNRVGATSDYRALNEIVTASYVSTLAYWIWSFSRQEVTRREFSPQMERFLVSISGSAKAARLAMKAPGGKL